jgi:hypothetical protein
MRMKSVPNAWISATRGLGLLVVLVAIGACGSNNAGNGDGGTGVPPCTNGTDLDGDRYGDGCPAGQDCNDFDPTVNTICPDANCADGIFQGCPCDPSVDQPVSCYDGPANTSGNPPCVKGMRSCDPVSDVWSACGGQILPSAEVCDNVDNDCDGDSDEGVASACGNCTPGCDSTGVGTDPFPFPPTDPDVEVDGVGLDPNGDLVLDSSTIENHYLWIANDPEGTVSKLDTRTGKEVARYASVTHDNLIVAPGATNAVPAWNASSNRNRPSRTAIDFKYDVWVANRVHDAGDATTGQASLTKIRNVTADCIDRNGNLQIDTSSDVNNDGVISINDPLEFFGEQDECIAMTVAVGTPGSIARAVAIDSGIDPGDPGDAWVGLWGGANGERAFYEINGRTGQLIQRVPATGQLAGSPYGAAIDGQGRLWTSYSCCTSGNTTLARIHTWENPATLIDSIVIGGVQGTYASGQYGMTVDSMDRVWVGGWTAGYLKRYNPVDGSVVDAFIASNIRIRGVGIDTHGNVWAAVDQPTGMVARVNANTATQTGIWSIGGTIPVGVGVDFDGDVWTVNQSSSNASRLHIDQTTLEPAPHAVTSNQLDLFPTGPNPYTYSDFTGLGLRTVTRPTGDYVVPLKGCDGTDEATWLSVAWDATTPVNTSVEIWVRVGNDLATLGQQPTYGPWTVSPADLTMAPGPVPAAQYMQLTIRLLSSDNESTPIVHGYDVQWACPGEPIE